MIDWTLFAGITTPCMCFPPEEGCMCEDVERVLRAYASTRPMPVMTPTQREACLEEIQSVEGYDRTDYEQSSDADLAKGVLYAWVDYCRDKGLL